MYNSQALSMSLSRLVPGPVPHLKLIIPQGYIQGSTVSIIIVHRVIVQSVYIIGLTCIVQFA